MQRTYEVLVLVPNIYTDQEIDGIITKINDIIKNHKGEILETNNFGKRKLAYQIKTFTHGYYIAVKVNMEAQSTQKLSRDFKLSDEILRHQIVLFDPKWHTLKPDYEPMKRKEAVEKKKPLQSDNKPLKAEKTLGAGGKRDEFKIEKTAKGLESNSAKALEELDEKLDNILEGKDLNI